jgi:hypothetical protein
MPNKLTIESFDSEVQSLYKDNDSFVKEQDEIRSRIHNTRKASEDDIAKYVLTSEDKLMFDAFKNMAEGKEVKGFNLKDYLASPQAVILIPKIIIGAARRAAEPVYLASKFFKKVRSKNSNSVMMMPVIGTMIAEELAEGQAPKIQGLDIETMSRQEFITTSKKGIRIQITEQYINEAQWDLVTYLIEEAGFAMARLKEQLACIEFSKRGWTVFDNSIRASVPEAGTTGLNYNGNLNDTLSIDDFMDMVIAVMNNEKTPTDILMHPLTWTVFARNGLTGGFTGPGEMCDTMTTPNSQLLKVDCHSV